MLKKTFITVALLSCVAAGAARADHYYKHGTTCQPVHGDADLVHYEERGVGNYSTSTTEYAQVFCPLQEMESYDPYGGYAPTFVRVHTVDNSTTNPFYCYLFATDANTDSEWGATRHTCNTALSGCDGISGGESASGYVYMSFSNIDSDPDLDTSFHVWGVRCYIPPQQNGARSFVKVTDTYY